MARETSFSVRQRNPRHWDIWNDKSRIFRIRGKGSEGTDKTGSFCVMGDYEHNGILKDGFETMSGAMGWITDFLMHENI